jgi:hypothetical protein
MSEMHSAEHNVVLIVYVYTWTTFNYLVDVCKNN